VRGDLHIDCNTARDTNDRDLQDRMTKLLPWLAEVMAACEANYDARQQAAKAAAVQAAIQAQTPPTPPNGQRQPPPRDPLFEPTNDTDPSWCPIHRCAMPRRTNARGSWYSHRLPTGD
jgi:hypothetical protein